MSTRCPRGSVFRNCSSAAGTRPASQGVKFSRKRFSQNSGRAASSLDMGSTFYADDLLQRVHDVDQIGLVGHHLFDILVSSRDLVQHALVLAALDALRLRDEVSAREAAFRFAPAHS